MVSFPIMNLISIVKTQNTRKHCLSIIAISLSIFLPATGAHSAPHQELQGVKSEIVRQQRSLKSQSKKLDSLQSSLKSQELTISSLEKSIASTKKKLSTANANIKQLEKKISDLEAQKIQQSDHLKKLIYTFYITSQSRSATRLLEDNSNDDRISQYYQHLAKARAKAIEALQNTQQKLNENENVLKREKTTIDDLFQKQTQRYQKLKRSQLNRRSIVNKIRSNISTDKHYLAELQRNESRLKAEIAKAAKAARRNAVQMNGINHQRGKLPWPVQGNILHRFGTHQSGQINWKGIVIATDYRQPIKAVYPGTVVFSEYLRGYGLVILLDHGKGDMTLYGFNQSLLKKEGDKVHAGETIALAGDTGGQAQPSLYFEVRRNSQAQNPLSWLSK